MTWSSKPEKIPQKSVGRDKTHPHALFILAEDDNGRAVDNEPAWTRSGLAREAEAILQEMREKGLAESTIAHHARILERFINYLASGYYEGPPLDEPRWILRP